jgi:hypothetical protein
MVGGQAGFAFLLSHAGCLSGFPARRQVRVASEMETDGVCVPRIQKAI